MNASKTMSMAITSFVLGACATAAVTSDAQPRGDATVVADTPGVIAAAQEATVMNVNDAPSRVAPSGKARITHLARGDNAYVGWLEMDGGGAVPEHRDATEEYIHVVSGHGTITIDGQTYELTAGSTVYMPANATVSYQNGAETLVAIQVFAGPAPAAKYDDWAPAS